MPETVPGRAFSQQYPPLLRVVGQAQPEGRSTVVHAVTPTTTRDGRDGHADSSLAASLDGGLTTLTGTSIADLGASLCGRLIRPGDRHYDESRIIWNRNIDRRPALIARCRGAADVIACVRFARDHRLLLSVRGGGHNFSGTCLADNGLVIDLSEMASVRVDPARRTARAEGGTKWGQFDRETQAFGLASTGGTNPDTGIAGLTLGGGMGWLAGKHGLAVDNLLSADVVTAAGTLLVASADEHPDLFWAIRGGGGNFGVVTSFEYRLHKVGPLLTGLAMYPLARAGEVLRAYDEFASTVPDELTSAAAFATLPDGTAVVGIAAAYNGPLDAGETALQPLQRLGAPLVLEIEPKSYARVQRWLEPFTPEGLQYYETAHLMRQIPSGLAEVLADAYARASSPRNLILFQQLGNAANRVPADATAFGHRDAKYSLIIVSAWDEADAAPPHQAWARGVRAASAPYATGGVYVNAIGQPSDSGSGVVRSAYGRNYQRLAELKRKYDPSNLFRHNQNILPSA
jgi:FAD/FMN-containing dehydrogenase